MIMLGKEGGKWFIDIGWFKAMPFALFSLRVLDADADTHFQVFRLQIAWFIVEIGIWK